MNLWQNFFTKKGKIIFVTVETGFGGRDRIKKHLFLVNRPLFAQIPVVSREALLAQAFEAGTEASFQQVFSVPSPVQSELLSGQFPEQLIFGFCRRDHGAVVHRPEGQVFPGTVLYSYTVNGRYRSSDSNLI